MNISLESARQIGRERMQYALARFDATFAAVPEDRAAWKPAPSAKSALDIAGHCTGSNRAIARVLRGEADGGEPGGLVFTSLTEARNAVRSSAEEVIAALERVDEARFSTSPTTPFGPMAMVEWMVFSGPHLAEHAGQIDYLQTLWGDEEDHFPDGA